MMSNSSAIVLIIRRTSFSFSSLFVQFLAQQIINVCEYFRFDDPVNDLIRNQKEKNKEHKRGNGESRRRTKRKKASIYILAKLVTPSGIEPELPP